MSSPFVAEIRCVGFNFAPTGWAECAGQLMPISQNTALFSLLGTTYGGDGKSTFALPNLQGQVAMHAGQGPVSQRFLGEQGGSDTVTLLQTEMPAHSHNVQCAALPTLLSNTAVNHFPAKALNGANTVNIYNTTPDTTLNPLAVSLVGNGLPHNNDMPTLVLNFIIALQGVFPARS